MKTIGIFFVAIALLSYNSFKIHPADERAISYGLAQHYYEEKDYLLAYKYLLIYKYSHYELLQQSDNKNSLICVDNALGYCEKELGSVLSGVSHWKGAAWGEDQKQKFKNEEVSPEPILPETHP